MNCPEGTFGLGACRGEVVIDTDGKPRCWWHRRKREVFGQSLSRPVTPSPSRPDPCPTCGHQWFAGKATM